MKTMGITGMVAGSMLLALGAYASDAPGVSADDALKQLLAGNQRYVEGKPTRSHQDAARRTEVAKGQKPIAVIVGCSDSRVPPEIIFDQGLGDLFVVRVAGNVAASHGIGSIEYAVEHLGSRLVLVMGHERCGAVDATLKGGEAHNHIKELIEAIKPAVAKAKGKPGDALDNAVKANIAMVVEQLKASKPTLAEMVSTKAVKVVGARYDLDTGKVELIR